MAKKKSKKYKKLRHWIEAVITGAVAGTIGGVLAGLILKLFGN